MKFVKIPKDYKESTKILFGLTFKNIIMVVIFGVLMLSILALNPVMFLIRAVIVLFLFVTLLFILFFKSKENDDFSTYIFMLLKFYARPKHLIYKKMERNDD